MNADTIGSSALIYFNAPRRLSPLTCNFLMLIFYIIERLKYNKWISTLFLVIFILLLCLSSPPPPPLFRRTLTMAAFGKRFVRRGGGSHTTHIIQSGEMGGGNKFLFPLSRRARKAPSPLTNVYNFCHNFHRGDDDGGRDHCFPHHPQRSHPIPNSAEYFYQITATR